MTQRFTYGCAEFFVFRPITLRRITVERQSGAGPHRSARLGRGPTKVVRHGRYVTFQLAEVAYFYLITHYPQPVWCGTNSEHLELFQGVHHGTQQDPVPERPQ